MFLLFGFGKRTVKELGDTREIRCENCGNVRPWKYKKYTTWFTLFFIPIIPYQNTYVKECPICHVTKKIDKDEAMGNYNEKSESNTNDNFTDVQRNYRKHMEALNDESEE